MNWLRKKVSACSDEGLEESTRIYFPRVAKWITRLLMSDF